MRSNFFIPGLSKFLLAITMVVSMHVRAQTAYGPQMPAAIGPWFEGWYVRITDENLHRSFAVIVASQTARGERYIPGQGNHGYLAILLQDGEGQKTQSFESFPEKTFLQVEGQSLGFQKTKNNSNFAWEAPQQGFFTPQGFDLQIPGQIRVRASLGGSKNWSQDWENWGPEGFGVFFKFLPLHWFVESLASSSQYEITFVDEGGELKTLSGKGHAHIEKNWGKAFPQAWIWIQAHDEGRKSSVAMAGGILSLGPVALKTYLAGFKSPKVSAEFQMGQMFDMTYTDSFDACRGEYKITMQNGAHIMKLKAKADPASFASVSIPTPEGYLPKGGIESFSAEVEVEIHNNNWVRDFLLKDSLIDKIKFKKAALEFGADFQKCKP